MNLRLLIDECLSPDLVDLADARLRAQQFGRKRQSRY